MLRKVTKKKFKEWLESKSLKTKVAPKNYDCYTCPIAKFIIQTVKLPTNSIISIDPNFGEVRILSWNSNNEPVLYYKKRIKWVEKFVTIIDKKYNDCNLTCISISAKKALEILNRI